MKRALVQRILASPQFEKSPRLQDFLLYIADREMEGDMGSLKEQAIGHAVFKRPQSYDPVADNIVRVQARHLRQKVEQYFAAEGSQEPVVLEIPKGKYVPAYLDRGEVAPVVHNGPGRFPAKVLVPAVLFCVIVGAVAWSLSGFRKTAGSGTVFWPWSEFLDRERRTVIVTADSALHYVQKFAGRPVQLQDYARPNYPQFLFPAPASREQADLMATTASMRTTSEADLVIATQLMRVFGAANDRLVVRMAREVRYRELQESNLIVIGTAIGSNPWASLFESSLNFQSAGQPKTEHPVFKNIKPLPGEQAEYVTAVRSPNAGTAFGVVALLKHPDHTGHVMLLQGATMEASEAVGIYLMDPAAAAALRKRLGAPMRSSLHFEALLQTKAVSGTATQTSVIATRLHD